MALYRSNTVSSNELITQFCRVTWCLSMAYMYSIIGKLLLSVCVCVNQMFKTSAFDARLCTSVHRLLLSHMLWGRHLSGGYQFVEILQT